MENLRLSVLWWILGAKRSLWPTPMILKTKSPKNMNPPNGGAYFKPITRLLCRGGDEQIGVKVQFTGVRMVVFHFLVLPSRTCPRTLSRIYLLIWFWGTHGVTNIV